MKSTDPLPVCSLFDQWPPFQCQANGTPVLLSKFNDLVWIALLLIVVALGVGLGAPLRVHPFPAVHPWLAWVVDGLGLLVPLTSF
ncbi:MAG: hypothetical protein ACKOCM_00685 [Cyanobacteriota bacterium]